MYQLSSPELGVELLDPEEDRPRLGHRYCAGGYIWQVRDRAGCPLLVGPQWPSPAPEPFNGQGLPESFRHRTTAGEPLLWLGGTGFAPGAGTLALDAQGQTIVTEPSAWEIEHHRAGMRFRTVRTEKPWACEVQREVLLDGRLLVSTSRLTNLDNVPLKLEWFAHPFFPLCGGGFRAVVPPGSGLTENGAFVLAERELSTRHLLAPSDSPLEHLTLPAGAALRLEMAHPTCGSIHFETSFAPFKCVVWANHLTVSVEPFLALALAPGESREWSLRYRFGPD